MENEVVEINSGTYGGLILLFQKKFKVWKCIMFLYERIDILIWIFVYRHPKFGGTFIVRGVKSISDNDLIVHSLDNQISSAFDRRKVTLTS